MNKIFGKRKVKENFQKAYDKFFSSLFLNDQYKSYDFKFEVFREDVFNNPAVASAWAKIISAYGNLEFKVYKKVNGKLEVSNNSFVEKTLKAPSPLLNATQFHEYLLFYRMFGGMQLVERTDAVSYARLNVISPSNIIQIKYSDTTRIEEIQLNNQNVSGEDLDSFYLNCPFDPTTNIAGMAQGHTPYKALSSVADLINFILKHNISYVKNSGNAQGIFMPKMNPNQQMSKSVIKEMTDKVEMAFNNYKKAGEHKVLPQEMTFIDTSKAPKDLDWVKGFELALKMIANIMQVPLTLIWDTNSTYNNVSEAKQQLYKDTILPLAKSQCEFYTRIFADKLADNEIIYFDISNVEELKKDTKLVVEYLTQCSFMTINEKREYFSNYTGYKLDNKSQKELDEIWISSSLNTTTQAVEELTVEEGSGEQDE